MQVFFFASTSPPSIIFEERLNPPAVCAGDVPRFFRLSNAIFQYSRVSTRPLPLPLLFTRFPQPRGFFPLSVGPVDFFCGRLALSPD